MIDPTTAYMVDTTAQLVALRAEVERLRADAERYRWLRDGRARRFNPWGGKVLTGEKFDAAIDAARAAGGNSE